MKNSAHHNAENDTQHNAENETEISIVNIIQFLAEYRNLLIAGTVIGCLAAASISFLSGKYGVTATLSNSRNIVDTTTEVGIDYLMVNRIRKELPRLADKLVKQEKTNTDSYLIQLSNEKWWGNNIKPVFSFTKEDSKELFGATKALQEGENTKVRAINVTVTGASKEQALANLSTATSFIRNGAAYLELKDFITGYQIQLSNSESVITRDLLALEIESKYQNAHLASLEALKAKFPGSQNQISSQVVDLKDSSAKYLPLSTQLVAANRDNNMLKEQLTRLHDKKEQNAMLGKFLSQAVPVIGRNLYGLSALAEIAQIESSLRKEVKHTDLNARAVLDLVKLNLTIISTRYNVGLEQPALIDTKKPGYLKNVAIGLFAGFFLALLISFLAAIKLRYQKSNGAAG